MKQAKRYSHTKKPLKALSDDEIKRFLLCASANSRFLEILLALFCGLSRVEIYGLKFSDFDTDAKTLTVSREIVQDKKFDEEKQKDIYCSKVQELRTQNNYRTLAVPDAMFDELSKREVMIEANKMRYQPYYDEDYICCQKDGKTPALSLLNDALSAICKKSKLGSITVQDRLKTYIADKGELERLMKRGADKAAYVAERTLKKAKKKWVLCAGVTTPHNRFLSDRRCVSPQGHATSVFLFLVL